MREKEQISERRLVKRLTVYWERIKGNDIIPSINKFNGTSIEDVWQNCFHVSLQNAGKQAYKYEFVGSDIIRAYGKDPTGTLIGVGIEVIPGAKIIKRIDECLKEMIPLKEKGQFINSKNQVIKYRSCILPLGNHNTNKASHAIVGLSWRIS